MHTVTEKYALQLKQFQLEHRNTTADRVNAYLDQSYLPQLSWTFGMLGGGAAGGAFGGTVGAIVGSAGGPVGTATGFVAGVVVGATVGVMAAVTYIYIDYKRWSKRNEVEEFRRMLKETLEKDQRFIAYYVYLMTQRSSTQQLHVGNAQKVEIKAWLACYDLNGSSMEQFSKDDILQNECRQIILYKKLCELIYKDAEKLQEEYPDIAQHLLAVRKEVILKKSQFYRESLARIAYQYQHNEIDEETFLNREKLIQTIYS